MYIVTVDVTAAAFLGPELIGLSRQNWSVDVLASPSSPPWSPPASVGFFPIQMDRNPRPVRDAIAFVRILWRLRQIRPQLVVFSTPKASLLGSLASWAVRIPTRVYHSRGLRLEGLAGVTRWVALLAERLTARLATHVVADSPSLAFQLRRHRISHNAVVIGAGSCCGVDGDFFRHPTSAERTACREALNVSGRFVFTYIGRLARDKGLFELLEAFEAITDVAPIEVALILAGPPEDDQIVEALIRLDSPEVAVIPRFVAPRPLLWASDVFVYPSHREGLPIAVLEASACGLPVVTTNSTGCIDAVIDGVTGYSVAARDPAALTEALRQLLLSPSLTKRLGSQGHEVSRALFSQSQLISDRIAWLNEISLQAPDA